MQLTYLEIRRELTIEGSNLTPESSKGYLPTVDTDLGISYVQVCEITSEEQCANFTPKVACKFYMYLGRCDCSHPVSLKIHELA